MSLIFGHLGQNEGQLQKHLLKFIDTFVKTYVFPFQTNIPEGCLGLSLGDLFKKGFLCALESLIR